MDESNDSLMTADEVAAYLGVHPQTVRRLVKSKKIPKPIVLSPRNIRWHRGTLIKWARTGVIPGSDNGTGKKGEA